MQYRAEDRLPSGYRLACVLDLVPGVHFRLLGGAAFILRGLPLELLFRS